MKANNLNVLFGSIYFFLATVLTGVFVITKFWLYDSTTMMELSGAIAVSVWLIQIISAFLFINNKKWFFIKRISLVYLIGSVILFSYYLMNLISFGLSGIAQFIVAIAFSTLIMIPLYNHAVKRSSLSLRWFWGWIFTYSMGIMIQLTLIS